MSEIPAKFQRYDTLQSKKLVIVVEIEGFNGILSNGPVFEVIRYGDSDLTYGAGYYYGQLRLISNFREGNLYPILSLEGSSLILSQRLEPEQGRGSISTLTLAFIDKDSFMTELLSPGFIVNDILGKKVKVWIGYQELSFPEDYYVVFRGKITNLEQSPGIARLTTSDPNIGRRSQIFYKAKTKLTTAISDSDTTISVAANGDFHKMIFGPDGVTYDPAIKLFLKIGDEYIEYGPTASLPSAVFGTNVFSGCVRAARGTFAEAHDVDSDVEAYVEIEDHAIDMALKIMLSGWNGPCISDVSAQAFRTTGDPNLGDQPGAIILGNDIDAERDIGVTAGDYVTVTGTASNDGTYRILNLADSLGYANRLIYVDAPLVAEVGPGTLAFRSQFDTYPTSCGSKQAIDEVDVERHLYYKNTFLGAIQNSYRFFIQDQEVSAKQWLESEVYLPLACYSLTRFGRLSMGLTKPPIADERLQFLNKDNILNADQLTVTRGITSRRYFNQIDWNFDLSDDGTYVTQQKNIDTDSLQIIGLPYVLPITSKGLRTDLGTQPYIDRRTQFLIQRYKKGAIEVNPKVNFEVGVQIEAGDVVALQDNGFLQLPNYDTGVRNLGTKLFEVTERALDLRSGNVQLKLLSGLTGQADDKFGVISPSSLTAVGSTTTKLRIKDSYGAVFPGDERRKWEDYVGLPITIHNGDWTYSETVTLVSLDPTDYYGLLITPALSSAPGPDLIIDIEEYPNNANAFQNQAYKQIHCFLDPSIPVVSLGSSTSFQVDAGDIDKFLVGAIVLVHDDLYVNESVEAIVTSVNTGTNTVFVNKDLGIVPDVGYLVELIGFKDKGAPYRFI